MYSSSRMAPALKSTVPYSVNFSVGYEEVPALLKRAKARSDAAPTIPVALAKRLANLQSLNNHGSL